MAPIRLKIALGVFVVYFCCSLLIDAKDFTREEFEQTYDPEAWGPPIEEPAAQNSPDNENGVGRFLKDSDFKKSGDISKEAEMESAKRGTKNDRLRGLRRLSRLYGELGLDYLRPVKKSDSDDALDFDDKRVAELVWDDWREKLRAPGTLGGKVQEMLKRDAGPHAWYGTGMFGKRMAEGENRRWRTRSPRPQPFRIGLFGKREYNTQQGDLAELAELIASLRGDESRR